MNETYDKIIIGAGLYGLYAAKLCGEIGEKVLVLEHEDAPFKRATYINQARVHMGYHYPRSYSTATKSANYFNRFYHDYGFSILDRFDQVYATSKNFSWSNALQFKEFCKAANIHCEELNPNQYFQEGLCDGAFLTKEFTYDAKLLKKYFLEKIKALSNIKICYRVNIQNIINTGKSYCFTLSNGKKVQSQFVLNATYASVNQILNKLNFKMFPIKYELCEIILCNVWEKLKNVGITVMDGPFFSIMPFGKSGMHSLTSVTFTPHVTCKKALPIFECQTDSKRNCSPHQLENCNECQTRPESAWPYMSNLARKYIRKDFQFEFNHSLFSIKPILLASEIDDSRPTVIRAYTTNPTFISVLSGKINTVYDLDEILTNGSK